MFAALQTIVYEFYYSLMLQSRGNKTAETAKFIQHIKSARSGTIKCGNGGAFAFYLTNLKPQVH